MIKFKLIQKKNFIYLISLQKRRGIKVLNVIEKIDTKDPNISKRITELLGELGKNLQEESPPSKNRIILFRGPDGKFDAHSLVKHICTNVWQGGKL